MAELILDEVSRVFSGSVRAVDRLSLEIHDQEFLVLVGPSGCGKSTTLRLIAGLEQPGGGRVRIGGRDVNGVPAWQRNVAMVFQHPALYPHLDVYRNIAFGLHVRERRGLWRRAIQSLRRPPAVPGRETVPGPGGAPQRETAPGRGSLPDAAEAPDVPDAIATRVAQVAQWLGIEHLLGRRPGELSGGQRQRVALGRAIVRRPEVFLLDEPLSNLDPGMRVEMRWLLAQLHGRLRTTTCYVTHDQAEALTLGQRVAVMNAGRLEQVGTPRQVYEQPQNRFVAGFIGSPPMSFLAGKLEQSAGGWRFLGRGWALSMPAEVARKVAEHATGTLLMGVRAEEVIPVGGVIGGSEIDGSEIGGSEIGGSANKTSGGIPARVMRAELLGNEQLVELQLTDRPGERGEMECGAEHPGGTCCVWIKVAAALQVQPGDHAALTFDFQRVHWFDPPSGRNLLWDSKAAC